MIAQRHTTGAASAAPVAASNVVPIRPREAIAREQLRDRIADDVLAVGAYPRPDMPPQEYRKAWLTLCLLADEARAHRDYIEARWLLLVGTDMSAAAAFQPMREPAFQRMGALIDAVASVPVPLGRKPSDTSADIRRKRRVIGRVWLSAKGERYDAWRASIAADEARLALQRMGAAQ